MKAALKQALAKLGLTVQRLPPGLPSGVLLERDLALVVGTQPAPLCIDVGANRGDFVELLRHALLSPRIHAFEPAPGPFARLQQRHAARAGVTLVPAGLSDHPGELSLHIFDNEALNSFLPLAPGAQQAFGGTVQVDRRTAPVMTLDTYTAGLGIERIDLLKIDTQGFELHVLRGAHGLLASGRVRAALVELNFMPLYDGQASATEVIAFLQHHHLYLVDFYEKCRKGQFLGWCTALFAYRPPV